MYNIELNRITKNNISALRKTYEMFDTLCEARVFSKIYLKTRIYQIRMKIEYLEKTALNTKYEKFKYFFMPLVLCNAPVTFLSLMNKIFHDGLD